MRGDPPGWHDLILEYTDKMRALGAISFYTKEKYGALVIESIEYTPGADVKGIQRLVEEAEILSECICQDCGEPGKEEKISDWILTLCANCADSRRSKSYK